MDRLKRAYQSSGIGKGNQYRFGRRRQAQNRATFKKESRFVSRFIYPSATNPLNT